MTETQVAICGGGNLGHVLAGLLASNESLRVHVLVSSAPRAARWKARLATGGGIEVHKPDGVVFGQPDLVTAEPAEAVSGSQVILLALPAFLHEVVLRRIEPHVSRGAWVGAVPGHGGFQWRAAQAFAARGDTPTLFGLRKSPWSCRVISYGKSVRVSGNRDGVTVATHPRSFAPELADRLGELLGVNLTPIPDFLHVTLGATNQLLHPGVLYGRLRGWDGAPLARAPLAYEGIDQDTADVLQEMSTETQAICIALDALLPEFAFSTIRPLVDEIRVSCHEQIEDHSSLKTVIGTNRSLYGLNVPCREVEGGWTPDFGSRWFAEDVPFGLCVLRGIAEISGVPTPQIDEVLSWAQDKLGVRYLEDEGLCGSDVSTSGAPQAFSILSARQLVSTESCC